MHQNVFGPGDHPEDTTEMLSKMSVSAKCSSAA